MAVNYNKLLTHTMLERPLRITQTHLKVLADEPHQFRPRFLDGLGMPAVFNAEAIARGRQFHQLMHQRSLHLPVEDLVAYDHNLQRYFDAYEHQPPPLLSGDQLAEYPLAVPFVGFQLFGVLDVLVRNPQQMQIVDWKTYRRARPIEDLREDWQTRLYLFLLATWSEYPPESLSMVYWFAEAPRQTVEIHYSSEAFKQDRCTICQLLETLNQWLTSGDFPTTESLKASFELPSIEEIPSLPLP